MSNKPTRTLVTMMALALMAAPVAKAAKGNSGGNGGGGNGSGNTTGATGGMSGGNNGNGVGNTGPGNQGNTSPNGNAGGTTTSSSNGGGNNNGSGNGGNTGGMSGGNNGNGVGNTGPGNQGNTSPNGNAGGTTTSSSNGGSQGGNGNGGGNTNGNGNGGNTTGHSGGNNGNGVGNTGPGNQGNDGPNGNAGGTTGTQGGTSGNAQGGATGNAQGGTNGNGQGGSNGNAQGGTTGSQTSGGQTSGGQTSGGQTSGGQTSGGGSTTGGQTSGGSTGGQTSGGSTGGQTSGGGSTGGQTGETNGGSSGGSTGGGTTGGEVVAEEKIKPELKVRVLPLAFGNYDIAKKVINLTPAARTNSPDMALALDEYRNGFAVTQMRMWDAGLGVAPQMYLQNASGLASLATAVVGLAPTKGKMVQFERLIRDEKELHDLQKLEIPYTLEKLAAYKVGESVTYENMGGILFSGGAGVAGIFTGGSVAAEGGFKTTVLKSGADKAYVQVNKLKIRKASLFTGAAILKIDASTNKQLSDGFSYEFDFNAGDDVVDAYEAILTGNATLAQEMAAKGLRSGVKAIDTNNSVQTMKKRGLSLGIPMVAIANWSTGRTQGHSETMVNADKTTTQLDYGVYFKEQTGRFFHKHKRLMRSFYSGKAQLLNKNMESIGSEQKATYLWSYENDKTSAKNFERVVNRFHRDLGLRSVFNPFINSKGREKLGYVKLEAQVEVPEAFTKRLIGLAMDEKFKSSISSKGMDLLGKYFQKGDVDELCVNEESEYEEVSALDICKEELARETSKAVKKINDLLLDMASESDSKKFVALQANMGKELVKNQFVLGSLFSADSKCELAYSLKLHGERLSKIDRTVKANPACR